jgi:Mn-dependent DtxR family transcriptional regulator
MCDNYCIDFPDIAEKKGESMLKKLYRTTIVIWTKYDASDVELEDLARKAVQGEGYCSQQTTEAITDPVQFPKTEFFGEPEE